MKTYRKQKTSKQTAEQKSQAKTSARKLYNRILQHPYACILMDDETYVKEDSRTLSGSQFYTKVIGQEVSDAERSIQLEKKVLVWQAICSCGLKSSTFYTKGTINVDVYRTECFQKRLLLLHRKHSTPSLFWPDLASAHYAKATLKWLQENAVEYVEKDMNPPNCPQLRPIERYWAIVRRIFKKDGKVSETMEEFKNNWSTASKKCNSTTVRNLMEGVKSKLGQFVK